MYDTMDLEEGVGLAAPQVGVRKRLFTYDLHEGDGPGVVINPEIVERDGEVDLRRGLPVGARLQLRDRARRAGHDARASTSTATRSCSRATTCSPA